MIEAPLRLGFVRGTSPAKWAQRWTEARPDRVLEMFPLGFDGLPARTPEGERPAPPDVTLERVRPGERPASTSPDTDAKPRGERRLAVRLYTEAVALVVPADHELAETSASGVDLDTIRLLPLLDHPDHAPQWPAAAPWEDSSWKPKHAAAAAELVATGAGVILLPLPLARHVARGREHAVLPLPAEAELPSTEIWASWPEHLDGDDIQQLIGIMRGRTARSSRNAVTPAASAASGEAKSGAGARSPSRSTASTSGAKGGKKPGTKSGGKGGASGAKKPGAKKPTSVRRPGRGSRGKR